ncbi:MAG: FtsK/SpoIIIE domain-containing protein [Ilumatobacteraceae bacterium]
MSELPAAIARFDGRSSPSKPEEWWTESADDRIVVPVGRRRAGEPLRVWFGHDPDQLRSCVHGILGAMPGAGKSTLLHNLICSLAVRYSPDDLELFLIDGKYGWSSVPAAIYRTLGSVPPHLADHRSQRPQTTWWQRWRDGTRCSSITASSTSRSTAGLDRRTAR